MKYLSSLAFFLTLSLTAAMVTAADDHQMPQHQPNSSDHGDFHKEYMKAMDQMHGPMMEGVMASDPDAAFVKGMIPHHKGAVAMAEIQLKYGQDPQLRKLAQEIIAAQDKEIELMEKWLKENPGK